MSSATRSDPSLGKGAGGLVDFDKMARLGMSPRQQELNHLYAFYRCQNYDARRIDWDGREHVDGIEREAIARGGFIPPGFYDAGATFPLKWRRPSAPYNLARVIVDRFTGLLFSERRHPQLRVPGDPATEDYATALAESGRLWQTMIQARAYGGAMGSVAVGFQFIDGKPVVEAHDPRWCIPVFSDRASLKLKMLEKRYMFPIEERDPQTGIWVNVMYWYRRVLDENYDVVWKPQLVGDGSEPNWGDESTMDAVVEHNLGFCPVVWVQNQPLDDSIDGDPDCHGVYDMIESIDALLSQANRGILANCDPTVLISTTDQLSELTKGSDNALKLTNGTASYMEISGSGPKAALELAESLRSKVLEVAQCILDRPDSGGAQTATEIERAYSSMLSKADIMREQYGERCVKPLMEMMVAAARKATRAVHSESGITRGALVLPAKISQLPDGTTQRAERKLGPGGALKLTWPGYFEPTLTDASQAVGAAGQAKGLGLVDDEHAVKFVAEYFHVEDVSAMVAKMQAAAQAQQDSYAQQSLGELGGGGEYAEEPAPEELTPDEAPAEDASTKVPLPMADIKLGVEAMEAIVTVNEARQSVGLDILYNEDGSASPDGDLTIAEYKVKKADLVAAATNATAGETLGPLPGKP